MFSCAKGNIHFQDSHPAERVLPCDWSVNNFIMTVYENYF